ncbi:MAG: pilus assembly protein TadG-related protein [Actinomycetota bacterium]|nr:pilus assembly protein TadG-related protein [Actinomycetota bacterium]
MRREQRGVVTILYAFALTAVVTVAAMVLDLAQLRSDRRINKSIADTAVRAGLGVLQAGPWSGVCRAREYLRANAPGLSSFDPGSEKWSKPASTAIQLATSPCANPTISPFTDLCVAQAAGVAKKDTWAKLTATAGGGRYTVEIQSGYLVPDGRFAEDQQALTDTGDPLRAGCDQLAVIITQTRTPLFAGIFERRDRTTTIRTVGRLSSISSGEYNPALLLLERNKCDVLVAGSNNTRVIAQPYQDSPGVIQIDSADTVGCSNGQAVLNGAATSGGPAIVACSAKTGIPAAGCNPATANKAGRLGIYALNFYHPPGDRVTTDFNDNLSLSTYGDTRAVASAQSGRKPIDTFYRNNVRLLDADAKAVLTGNAGKPPGCPTSTASGTTCTGTGGRSWLYLAGAQCSSPNAFFAADPTRTQTQNIWFNCDLNVGSPLTLDGTNTYVAITGQLHLTSAFSITDPRTVYIGGRGGGDKIGVDVDNGGVLSVNRGAAANCAARAGINKYTKVVVGDGRLSLSSSGAAYLCQTFVYMASGYDKVPATDNTPPCSTPCSSYLGTISIGSGASVDWSAPNLITNRQPKFEEVDLTATPPPISPYENIAFWTEAGGNGNSINGNGSTSMTGVYFLGNADAFNLAGNSGAQVYLSAQFISRTMKVTGGAVVNLVLNPVDAIPIYVYEIVLIR